MTTGEGPATTQSSGRRPVSVWALMLGTGPRFARDAFGPVVVFYVGWKTIGLGTGTVAATLVAVGAFGWERWQARAGLSAFFGLGIALVQALSALASGSVIGYFAPPLIVNGAYGLAFFISVMIGRPLAGVLAAETYPFPPAVRASVTFRRVFARISLVWATYFLLRSAIRLWMLMRTSVDVYVLINLTTGVPFTVALMSWSIWYGVRGFRRSEEWGGYLRE